MPGSADRVEVWIRCDPTTGEQVRVRLSDLIDAESADGHPPAIVIAGSENADGDHPVLVIGPDDEKVMLQAVDDGATGYVLESASPDELLAAITDVASGGAVIPPMMLGSLLRHAVERRRAISDLERKLGVLTDREREVIAELAVGLPRRDIALSLGISSETVRTHIQRAMTKLDVHSQTELMALLAPLETGQSR